MNAHSSIPGNGKEQGYLVKTVEKLAAQCVNGNVRDAVETIRNMRSSEAAFVTLHVHAALLRHEAFIQASELASQNSWQYH